MIVLGEKREGLNVVHLIMGPESDFQLDMSGQCIIDITEHHQHTSDGDHMIIVLNRCQSEQKVAERLTEINKNAESCTCEDCTKERNEKQSNHKQQNNEQSINLKCPHCFEEGKGILKNGLVLPCKACQKISDGLDKHNIASGPSTEQLKVIIEDMIKKNPKEFQLLVQKIYSDTKKKGKSDV